VYILIVLHYMYQLQQKIQLVISRVVFITLVFFCLSNISFSEEYTSTNFKILNPVVTGGGGFSSSLDYKLDSSISQMGIGPSTSTGFGVNAGFLYFPYVTTPVISATAGNGQVSLSWTAASGVLGWTASGYNIGYSSISGGPYAFGSSLGNVLSTTQTSLTNGTPYYFVVRVEDALGNIIATSSQVSTTPVAPYVPPSGGGGGGGGYFAPTSITFDGRAYPRSTVTLLKDAQIVATTVAGADANFQISVPSILAGNYIFSIYGEDNRGVRSSLLSFPVSITSGATTRVSGIFIAPTILVDKSEVKLGDTITIFGQTVSSAEVLINVNSEEEFFFKIKATADGMYVHQMDTSPLNIGSHSAKSKAIATDEAISSFSSAVAFTVGTKNILAQVPKKCPAKGDLNNDCRVNLVDFSIASFWYKSVLSTAFKAIEIEKLNGDGKVNLTDFSIMAFYWTG
jgi:hypothetical protein